MSTRRPGARVEVRDQESCTANAHYVPGGEHQCDRRAVGAVGKVGVPGSGTMRSAACWPAIVEWPDGLGFFGTRVQRVVVGKKSALGADGAREAGSGHG